MNPKGMSNDNRPLERGGLDPDRHYIRDYLAKACVHFKESGFQRETIADAMLDELFKMLDGNPFRTQGDEAAVRADMQVLWRLKHRILPMTEIWEKGWTRLQNEKRPRAKFARAVQPARPSPVRQAAPPPTYDGKRFKADLLMLKMREGHAYTAREVLARHKRRVARFLPDSKHANPELVVALNGAKKRLLNWLIDSARQAKVQSGG